MYSETITNHTELFARLEVIRDYENTLAEAKRKGVLTHAGIEHCEEIIAEHKRAARDFLRRERESHEDQPEWVLQDGEYMITRVPIPRHIQTFDQAEAWFLDNEYMPLRYSAYDCTGQIFTRWYKIINRNGRFQAYHAVSVDV